MAATVHRLFPREEETARHILVAASTNHTMRRVLDAAETRPSDEMIMWELYCSKDFASLNAFAPIISESSLPKAAHH